MNKLNDTSSANLKVLGEDKLSLVVGGRGQHGGWGGGNHNHGERHRGNGGGNFRGGNGNRSGNTTINQTFNIFIF